MELAPCYKTCYTFAGMLLTPDNINRMLIDIICKEFNIDEWMLSVKCRKKDFVIPRHLYRYFLEKICYTVQKRDYSSCRKDRYYSFAQIGEMTGGDHSTVIHSVRVMQDMIDTDKKIKAIADKIKFKTGLRQD